MLPWVILKSPEAAAFQSFPFLSNVHSLVGSTWVISEDSGRSITPLSFLLSHPEANLIIGGYLGLVLYQSNEYCSSSWGDSK